MVGAVHTIALALAVYVAHAVCRSLPTLHPFTTKKAAADAALLRWLLQLFLLMMRLRMLLQVLSMQLLLLEVLTMFSLGCCFFVVVL